jgi:hypothetical protein
VTEPVEELSEVDGIGSGTQEDVGSSGENGIAASIALIDALPEPEKVADDDSTSQIDAASVYCHTGYDSIWNYYIRLQEQPQSKKPTKR